MKPARFLTMALIMILSASVAFAVGTPANTKISNTASGAYKDSQNNDYTATSNTVVTNVAQDPGVAVSPDTGASNLTANSFVLYSTTVTNEGNYKDDIGLSAAVTTGSLTGTYTVEIYEDVDGDGVIDDGVDLIVTSTDSIAADAEFDVILKVTEASGDNTFEIGEVFAVTLTATGHGAVNDTGVFTSTIVAADIDVTVDADNPSPNPGETITYAVCIDNNGTDIAYDAVVNIPIDSDLIYVTGSIWYGAGEWGSGTNPTDNVDGDNGEYTSNTVTVRLGDIGVGASICVYFQATVDPAATPGSTIDINPTVPHDNDPDDPGDGTGYDDDPDETGDGVQITIPTFYNPTVAAVSGITDDGFPNDEIVYTFTVTNDGNVSDIFNLSYLSDEGWTWTIYLDDGDDTWEDDGSDTEVTSGNTGSMAVGATLTYHIVIDIPGTAVDSDEDVNVVTATSQGDSTTDDVTFTTTVTAPLLSLVKSVLPAGAQPPGTELTYTVVITNTGSVAASTIVISDNIPTNTTYVTGSLEIDSVSKTDEGPTDPTAPDSDGAQCDGTTAQFDFSSIASAGSNTVSFKVVID